MATWWLMDGSYWLIADNWEWPMAKMMVLQNIPTAALLESTRGNAGPCLLRKRLLHRRSLFTRSAVGPRKYPVYISLFESIGSTSKTIHQSVNQSFKAIVAGSTPNRLKPGDAWWSTKRFVLTFWWLWIFFPQFSTVFPWFSIGFSNDFWWLNPPPCEPPSRTFGAPLLKQCRTPRWSLPAENPVWMVVVVTSGYR